MSLRGKQVCEDTQNDMRPISVSEPTRSDTIFLAGEPPRASDAIKWTRAPELTDLEKTSDLTSVAGYCCLEDLVDASASERSQQDSAVAAERPGWPSDRKPAGNGDGHLRRRGGAQAVEEEVK